jgi:phage terminase large subunit-like protein
MMPFDPTTSPKPSPEPSAQSLLADIPTQRLLEILRGLPWRAVRRPSQVPPEGDWFVWLILAGRGWGKTRTGAEFVAEALQAQPNRRAALVAQTFDDGRDVMVEGESGLLSCLPEPFAWNRSQGQLVLPNGSRADIYSSEQPRALRGPQHHVAWGDEPAHWEDARKGDEIGTTWSNLKLGLRLGEHPRCVLTTTPQPTALLTGIHGRPGLLEQPNVVVTRGSTYENLVNLAPTFAEQVLALYEGTRTGRQELHAEILTDNPRALWQPSLIEATRAAEGVERTYERVVVAVDPSASSQGDEAGIVVAAKGKDGHGYVLADKSLRGSPYTWALAAVTAYHDHKADRIVAEANNGGEMVELTIRTVDPNVPVKLVNASRGKVTRAEPIVALYEKSRVHHVGPFPELEEQQTSWVPGEGESPDRLDALVWALTELMVTGAWGGRVASGIA